MSDEEIIKSILKGDINAFSELVERYKDRIYSMAFAFINDDKYAEDLSQEIFIKLYKNLGKFKGESSFSTWLFRLSKNYCIDWMRKHKNEINLVELDELSSNIDFVDEIINKDDYNNLRNEINELPDKYKQSLYLYHFKGYTYQEISDKLKVPKKTVETRIYRAKKILKNKLWELGGLYDGK